MEGDQDLNVFLQFLHHEQSYVSPHTQTLGVKRLHYKSNLA